ncbi:MAG: SAM-dependent methyltransferase [Rickettsiales bacterium]|nr:MAG: SAM-dependent methyltransferase [Rickettsiales bacterium]
MPIDLKIRNIIKEVGHIKIDDMMREALTTNNDSYYRSVQNLGEGGDFITAPEISQLFGEVIALWAIEKWKELGSPSSFALVELGGGQGKLMRDFLRTAKLVPEFFKAAKICLFEVNPHFIKKQQQHLDQYDKQTTWLSDLKNLPKLPTILIANEFFDALPIKQYLKSKDNWFEQVLVIDPSDGMVKHHKLELHKTLKGQLLLDHTSAQDGAILEESVDAFNMMRLIAKNLSKYGGASLIIDYGYDIDVNVRTRKQYNATLQAIKNHKYESIIATMGEADLTAHVDFNALKKVSTEQGLEKQTIFSQGEFLAKYGIDLRLDSLKQKLPKSDSEVLERQVYRLTAKSQMGELFKVLEVFNSAV